MISSRSCDLTCSGRESFPPPAVLASSAVSLSPVTVASHISISVARMGCRLQPSIAAVSSRRVAVASPLAAGRGELGTSFIVGRSAAQLSRRIVPRRRCRRLLAGRGSSTCAPRYRLVNSAGRRLQREGGAAQPVSTPPAGAASSGPRDTTRQINKQRISGSANTSSASGWLFVAERSGQTEGPPEPRGV